MLDRLSTREKYLLGILGIVIFIFIFTRFVLGPQLEAYAAASNELKVIKARLKSNLELIGSFEKEKKALEEARREYNDIKTFFSTSMQDGGALARLGLEAQEEGVAITLFQPKPVVEREHYLELPIIFGIRGPYQNVINYLAKIEDSGNMINHSEIKLLTIRPWSGGKDEKEESGEVTAKLTLVIYANKLPEEKIKLKKLSSWAVGRFNGFEEASAANPYPEILSTGDNRTNSFNHVLNLI